MKTLISWTQLTEAFLAHYFEIGDSPIITFANTDDTGAIYITWTGSEGEEYANEINFLENVPEGTDADYDSKIFEVDENGGVKVIDSEGDEQTIWFYKKFNPFAE